MVTNHILAVAVQPFISGEFLCPWFFLGREEGFGSYCYCFLLLSFLACCRMRSRNAITWFKGCYSFMLDQGLRFFFFFSFRVGVFVCFLVCVCVCVCIFVGICPGLPLPFSFYPTPLKFFWVSLSMVLQSSCYSLSPTLASSAVMELVPLFAADVAFCPKTFIPFCDDLRPFLSCCSIFHWLLCGACCCTAHSHCCCWY